jgi:hypothetical protein
MSKIIQKHTLNCDTMVMGSILKCMVYALFGANNLGASMQQIFY